MTPEKSNWQGTLIFAVAMIIPLIGCVMAVYTLNTGWLVLLAPLIVLMEGAFFVGPVAWFVVMCLIDWRSPPPVIELPKPFVCTAAQYEAGECYPQTEPGR